MNQTPPQTVSPPRIEYLKVQNFRALRGLEFKKLTPLTVLLGPNGSGKSTVFDVFAFLAECFDTGLRRAWDKRGRARELKTRGSRDKEPVMIEIKYRERPEEPLITYHLEVDEEDGRPIVVKEWLRWKRRQHGAPFKFLDYTRGTGEVVSGELPDSEDKRIEVRLSSSDTLAVNTLGQLAEHPRVVALRNFIIGWHVSYLSFSDPIMARFVSDGTLKMLACLILLHDSTPHSLIGIEGPENFLHPRLLHGLAEECRAAAGSAQIVITTHSPFFVDALRPEEVRVLWRDEQGYTQCHPLDKNAKVKSFMDAGAQLGDLWMEGHFDVGDPLTRGGMAVRGA